MNSYEKGHDKTLSDAISLYISFAEDAYIERKPFVITQAHKQIKKSDFQTEIEYYNELTDYIISKL